MVDRKVCQSLLVEVAEYIMKKGVAGFSKITIHIYQTTRYHIQRVVLVYRSAAVASVWFRFEEQILITSVYFVFFVERERLPYIITV
jgi:hypothetical protein